MIAKVTMVNGDTAEITGDIVNDLIRYFSQGTRPAAAIGWVSTGNTAINFNHVACIIFEKETR